MKILGLTGDIACGKSTVAKLLVELGAAHVDADSLVHDLYADRAFATQVVALFASHFENNLVAAVEALIKEDGSIDRAVLGQIVFRDAVALRRAVEAALPGEGRWGTVLLADGNIGIGGDPVALLTRCRELVRPDGAVLVETDPDPDAHDVTPVVLRAADGRLSRPMPWARLGANALRVVATGLGLDAAEEWAASGRTVVVLRRTTPSQH